MVTNIKIHKCERYAINMTPIKSNIVALQVQRYDVTYRKLSKNRNAKLASREMKQKSVSLKYKLKLIVMKNVCAFKKLKLLEIAISVSVLKFNTKSNKLSPKKKNTNQNNVKI